MAELKAALGQALLFFPNGAADEDIHGQTPQFGVIHAERRPVALMATACYVHDSGCVNIISADWFGLRLVYFDIPVISLGEKAPTVGHRYCRPVGRVQV